MMASICHVSDSQQRTAAHISRLTVMEPQFIYQKQRWASFVHRGSSWAVCEMHSALQYGLAGERLISIKGWSLVLHEQTVHQFTRTTTPKTHLLQPLMIFFIMPPLGGGTEFLMDVILLVNTLQTLTIQWHPTKILRQMSQCLIVSLGSRCQRNWTQHSGDGEAKSVGLRCDIALWLHLTGFLSSVRNTEGSPMRPHENFNVKLKGVSYVFKKKIKIERYSIVSNGH